MIAKCGLIAMTFALGFGAFAGEAPKPGESAPDVSAVNEAGQEVKLSSFKDKQGVVLFFFPKADTPG